MNYLKHAALCSCLLLGAATPGLAQTVVVPTPGQSAAETEALRGEINRQNFQLRQEIERQNDRRAAQQPLPPPNIPVLRPPCQQGSSGNPASTGCR